MNGPSFQLMCCGFSCACNWLVFARFSESKDLCSGQAKACFALEFFHWALQPFMMSGISTFATPIFVFMSQSRVKALSCTGLVVFDLHSCAVRVSALLKIFSSCSCHLIILCTGGTLDWSGPLRDHHPPVWCVLLWPWSFLSSWQPGTPYLLKTCQGTHSLHLLSWRQTPHLLEKKTKDVPM